MQLDPSFRAVMPVPNSTYPDTNRVCGLPLPIWEIINSYASSDPLESNTPPPITDITAAQEALSLPELLYNRADVINYLFMMAQGKVSNMIKDAGTLSRLFGCLQLCTSDAKPYALSQSVFDVIRNSVQTLIVDCSQCNHQLMRSVLARFPKLTQIFLRYSVFIAITSKEDSSGEEYADYSSFQGGVRTLLTARKNTILVDARLNTSKILQNQWEDIGEIYTETVKEVSQQDKRIHNK